MDTSRFIEFAGRHWMMLSGLIIVIILLIQDAFETMTRKWKVITPNAAIILMNQEDCAVVDVREPNEYGEGHIENAFTIPVNKIEDRLVEIQGYKNSPVIVTCQSGTRSPGACKKLVQLGFSRIYELNGGMMLWEDLKLPLSKKKSSKK